MRAELSSIYFFMSLQQLHDAIQREILPRVRLGGTGARYDTPSHYNDSTAWFEMATQPVQEHPFHEWFWLLSGTAHLKINGCVRTMNAGDFCFLPPQMAHCDVYSRETPAYRSLWFASREDSIWCVFFDYEPLGEWNLSGNSMMHDSPELRAVRAALQHELSAVYPYSDDVVQGLLLQLAALLLRACEDSLTAPGLAPGRVASAVMRFLCAHYAENIALENVAKAVHLSPHHAAALFKKESGQTIFDALAAIRIERAAALLVEGKLPLREVVEAVGYRNVDHFSRVFRRMKGVPPSRYGRCARENLEESKS